MAKTMQCPNCGNYVEGKKIKSYSNKVARQGAKSLVHGATSVGGTATGAAIGSAILPGIGTILGAAAGFIGSAMFNQKVNESIDQAGDYIEDEFVDIEYEYTCPKCGHYWTGETIGEDEDEEVEEMGMFEDEEWDAFLDQMNNLCDTDGDFDGKDFDDICEELSSYSQTKYGGYYLFLESFMYSNRAFGNDNQDSSNDLLKARDLILKALEINYDADFEIVRIIYEICLQPICDEPAEAYEVLKSIPEYDTRDAIISGMISNDFSANILEGFIESIFGDDFELPEGCEDYISSWLYLSVWRSILLFGYICEEGNEHEKPNLELALKFYQLFGDPSEIIDDESNMTVQDKIDELTQKIYMHSTKTTSNNHANEQKYIDALKDLLEDGEISNRERRMLERIRQSLGISEQRATELETSLSIPQLTEDEQEYLDMYREYAEEGAITEKIRNRLDRFASALGISPERMKELETM